MPRGLDRALLACGILSSLLYLATDVLGGIRWQGYSYTSQAISELMAVDAPSRGLVAPLLVGYDLLVIAFGLGVGRSAGRERALRLTGDLLVAIGVVGLVATIFFPMHLRGAGRTFTDTMHVALTGVLVLFILLAMGFGAAAFGRRFRLYSIGTIVVLLMAGALAGLDAPRIEAGLPTPWLGVTERVTIYAYLLWVAVLAVGLLRGGARRSRAGLGGRPAQGSVRPARSRQKILL